MAIATSLRPRSISRSLLRQWQILKAVAFVTYKEWSAFRSHITVSLLVGPIYFWVQLFIWKAVYAAKPAINGFSLEQIISYYGITAMISYLIYDSADWNLQMLIHSGKFLTFMLRPVSHQFFALAQKVGHRCLGFWLEFVPIYLIFWFGFRIRLIPAALGWTMLSIGLSFILFFQVHYCSGISAFWLTRNGGVRRMLQLLRDICAGVFIPLPFFPPVVQKVLFFLPFQFITYVPVRVFLGSYELAGMHYSIPQIVGLQALAVLVMAVVTELLWRLGISQFTGVGA